jgi:hypothetical protein
MKNLTSTFFLFLLMLSFSAYAQENAEESKASFYEWDQIRELSLSFDESNWDGLLDSMRLYGNSMLTAKLTIDGKEYPGVGVRYRESRSFQIGNKRNSFYLKLDHVNSAQHHEGYRTLILSNALRDPSMVREVISFEIARKYMPAPQANYANLTINGDLFGLFVNVEAVDEVFLEKHFDSSDNAFVKAAPAIGGQTPSSCKKNVYSALDVDYGKKCYEKHYRLISNDGWTELTELIEILNNNTENIEDVLNVDRVLWMLAFDNTLANLSSYIGQYSNNYYLYKDDFDVFHPIVWDMNLSFGSYKNTGIGSDLSIEELEKMDPYLHKDNPLKPLISKLMAIPRYRKMYIAHIRTILEENFSNDQFEKRVKEVQRLITVSMYNDPNKFYSVNDFNRSLTNVIGSRSKIPGLVTLMNNRRNYLEKQADLEIIPPKIVDVEVFHRPKYSNKKVNTFRFTTRVEKLPDDVFLFYRFNENQPWSRVAMKEARASEENEPGDHVFEFEVDPRGKYENIEYYFMTINVGAANFYPVNYMFKPYSANLTELNR